MTTITALNVRLGMDVSNFSEGANLAKGEVTKVASIMRQSVPPAEKYKQELDLLNKAFSDAGKQSAQYANAVDFLNKKHQQGKYSAEEVAKAEQLVAKSREAAAAAAKHEKEELARLAEAEKQHNALMQKGQAVTQSVSTSQETYNRKIRELDSLLKSGAISQETYRRAVEKTKKELLDSNKASDTALSSIKGMAAAYLSFQTVTKAIDLASQVEDATIAFEVLTGSAKDGAKLFEQIRQFAAESPVTFSGATQAAKTMLSFGVAVQDVEQNLRMLSDVTGGNNERFKMLSLAFSQMSAAGRLMGQDLLQMINAGFNPLQQISKKTGESLIDLRKRMEDGGISAEEVRTAFQDATAEGGMFHGMTDRLADTVSGKLNIALSDMEQQLAKVGQAMGPLIKQLLDIFGRMKPIFSAITNLIDGISQGVGFVVAGLSDAIETLTNFAHGNFTEVTKNMDKFLDDLRQAERDAILAESKHEDDMFDKKIKNVDSVAEAERKAAKVTDDERKKRIEATLKETDELVKQAQRDKERAEKDFQRELEAARDDAMRFFDEQAKKNEERRAAVAKGPGAGMEVGSAEAAKFAADIVNSRIAGGAVQDAPRATQQQIAAKTAELLEEQRIANQQQQRQIQLAEKQLVAMEENGFQRFR